MIIVSDTSPVSNLILIGRLDLLRQLYTTVIVPASVDAEIRFLKNLGKDIAIYETAEWIRVLSPKNHAKANYFKSILDTGEAEAIALALELDCDFLLMDERIGTRIARDNGLKTLGLIGVLVKAKDEGLIPLVRPVLDDLRNIAGFWITDKFFHKILLDIGESK